jgi:uncharacterized protein YjbJ (UPF0337 family)
MEQCLAGHALEDAPARAMPQSMQNSISVWKNSLGQGRYVQPQGLSVTGANRLKRLRGGTKRLSNCSVCVPNTIKEEHMSWDMIEGNWKQFVGKVKEQWGKLTDDDLAQVNGKREQLEGKIQEKYGYGKDKTKAEVDDWIAKHK